MFVCFLPALHSVSSLSRHTMSGLNARSCSSSLHHAPQALDLITQPGSFNEVKCCCCLFHCLACLFHSLLKLLPRHVFNHRVSSHINRLRTGICLDSLPLAAETY